jgi:hypothetical protein
MHDTIPKYTIIYARGYTLELYSMTEIQQFSTAIFEVPDDDHIFPYGFSTKNSV